MTNGIRKKSGVFYTPELLANFVAFQVISYFKASRDRLISILDPAVGDGQLLLAIQREIKINKFKKASFEGFDINEQAVKEAYHKLKSSNKNDRVNIIKTDFLKTLNEDSERYNTKYDLIISNPPYVRTQLLGALRSQKFSKLFDLTGKIDLYHVFIEGIAKSLKPDGIAGVIVSNRFMTTKSGEKIRKRILEEFEILRIWDFGDTRLFKASVLPCVLLLKKKGHNDKPTKKTAPFTSIYLTKKINSLKPAHNIFDITNKEGVYCIDGQKYSVTQGLLNNDSSDDIWRIKTDKTEDWLKIVEKNTWRTFGDIGKIRVGVKTTADKIFIRSDWDEMEHKPELLKPIITHHSARRFKSIKSKKYILYPYIFRGGERITLDINNYPKTRAYLLDNREALENRSYIKSSGKKWYEIWVPHNPSLWKKPKIVFRDIAETPTFWMDLDKSIVNGDCYWLTNDYTKDEDLLWLALAIGNSKFIEKFYDIKFNNKLYSGRRRFMTQYVNQFPLPDLKNKETKKIIKVSKDIYKKTPQQDVSKSQDKLDQMIWDIFGLGEKISR